MANALQVKVPKRGACNVLANAGQTGKKVTVALMQFLYAKEAWGDGAMKSSGYSPTANNRKSCGCGSKPCTPGEHQNRWHMGVHPPQNGAIGYAPWPCVAQPLWVKCQDSTCLDSGRRLHIPNPKASILQKNPSRKSRNMVGPHQTERYQSDHVSCSPTRESTSGNVSRHESSAC